MVTKNDLMETTKELFSFHMDLCEQICNGNADCIRKCHGDSLKSMSDFISSIDPQRVSPDLLSKMVENYKLSNR
jgi:hypothetical protein